jgi:hypothetical protein
MENDKAITAKYRDILKEYWGYDHFRGIQEEIITSIGTGHDTLGLMHTGGGKSITFQVPTMATDGLCLVITPLVALMKDQVANLRSRHIKAAAIYSGMKHADIITTLENCIFGDYKFLYVSPERLASEIFLKKISKIEVTLITVDEAHCISQWGHDFRPAYRQISQIRALFPTAPVLALTATATAEVIEDIQQQLSFKEKNVHRMSFERKNLTYIVRNTENNAQELLHILGKVEGSAIIYTQNRKKTQEVAEFITANDLLLTHSIPPGNHRNISLADFTHYIFSSVRRFCAFHEAVAILHGSFSVGNKHFTLDIGLTAIGPTKPPVFINKLDAAPHQIQKINKIFFLSGQKIEVIFCISRPTGPTVWAVHHIDAKHNIVLRLPITERSAVTSAVGDQLLFQAGMDLHHIFRRTDIWVPLFFG